MIGHLFVPKKLYHGLCLFSVEEQKPPTPKPATPPPATPQPARPAHNPNRPVQMYISPDERINPPPTTVDGRYVAEHLGNALTDALSEIAAKRPADPIEYLAKWLYMYHANAKYNDKVGSDGLFLFKQFVNVCIILVNNIPWNIFINFGG